MIAPSSSLKASFLIISRYESSPFIISTLISLISSSISVLKVRGLAWITILFSFSISAVLKSRGSTSSSSSLADDSISLRFKSGRFY